jgi:hypothetical protein
VKELESPADLRGADGWRSEQRSWKNDAAIGGSSSPSPEPAAERIGEQRRLREGADEHQVDALGQPLVQVLEPGVADEGDLVAFAMACGRRNHVMTALAVC